jgi:hypothetical protein
MYDEWGLPVTTWEQVLTILPIAFVFLWTKERYENRGWHFHPAYVLIIGMFIFLQVGQPDTLSYLLVAGLTVVFLWMRESDAKRDRVELRKRERELDVAVAKYRSLQKELKGTEL